MANYIKDTAIQENSISETKLDSSLQSWKETVTNHINNNDNPHNITKSSIGLDNVTNDAQVKRSELGVANGVATLDSTGKVPSGQLPSYVDDVIEGYLYNGVFYKDTSYTTSIVGESGKIYIDLPTNKTYRWTGSVYGVISETIALGETPSTAYRGDRGKIAYDHSQSAHAPSNAQANVIETIKVNGTALTPNSKAVDITIPTVGNGTITIKQGGTSKGTFTTNQNGNTTIELTDTNTTYTAGDGLSLSGTTFSNNGVRSIATGTTNGTISVNTNGNISNIGVYGLKSAAYTNSSDYAAASHTHSYLPLSGGTISSNGSILKLNGTSSSWMAFSLNGVDKTSVGYTKGLSFIANDVSTARIGVNDSGTPLYKTAWNGTEHTLLHSGNYNSYAPKLDGTGATGTWGISISGNAATATNASSATNADKLDGYHLSQITPVVTKRDFTNGTLVKTSISFPRTNTSVSEPFLLTVRGNGYGGGIINFEFQGYVYYAKSYAHPQIISSDFIIYSPNSIDKIYTMSIDNKLCFWWARQDYWQGFHIFCTTDTESYQNRVTEVQDVSKPSGLFEQIYTPKLSLTTSNYTSYTVTKTGGGASGTWGINISGNAATATDADKLDGVHYQNILERRDSGYSESGTATGWFRIAETLTDNGGGITFLLAIQRVYNSANNESYLFSISISYDGGISITQLSGYANTRLITKIRVDWANIHIAYVDLYIDTSSTNNNGYYWYTVGCAKSYTAWTANPTLQGTAYEFTTVNGCKSDRGFTGDLMGNAVSATKLANSRTIWGHNFDGTENVKGALSGVTTINSTLYIDLSGNIGIGTASPSYKLYVNGDGYFVDNVITESDFSSRGDAIIDGTVSCTKLLQTSDIKYKTNIKQIKYEEALKIIENLNPVTWDWNENTIVTGSSSGFVAQEAEEFIPNAISRDNENNLSLDYTQLHSYEIRVIQEQQKEIKDLKQRLEVLENLVLQLTNREI